ncbi:MULTISPECIES: FixH family protein [unclassified Acidovorax]|uniref:FixH family protein n=1 Tax=unclassified Acidovorax TaxID=2684926 RepID=UPI0028830427|nr:MULTISPECIES: FixH family protein [unclassified Acidovorax]
MTHALSSTKQTPVAPAPWWRFGYVWLIIAGPAIVVVAGFVTLWLAISQPDPVLAEDYYQRGLDINKTLRQQDTRMAPAVKGRNHAATPVTDLP